MKKKAVKCITTEEIFESAQVAGNKYGIDRSNIHRCCHNKIKTAGKLDGEKLMWTYIINDKTKNDEIEKLKAEIEKLNGEIEKLKIKNKKLKTIIDTLVEDL